MKINEIVNVARRVGFDETIGDACAVDMMINMMVTAHSTIVAVMDSYNQ